MANHKSAAKAQTAKAQTKSKSGTSKLSTIKQALFGAGKKKPVGKASPKVASPKAQKASAKAMKASQPKGVAAKVAAAKEAKSSAGKGAKAALEAAKSGKSNGKGSAPAPAKAAVAQSKGKASDAVAVPVAKASKGIAMSSRLAEAEAVCREVACEGLATTIGYCRMHYIKNWKKIKRKEVILKEGKLNQYIEELVAKYPDKYIEAIRHDLAHDKDFAKVIRDLDLDESVDDFEGEGEGADAIIDSIKRDFDDEGDTGF